MRRLYISARVKLGLALGVSSVVSIGLYLVNAWNGHGHNFSYMIWNLFLAWLALVATLWLERALHRSLWSSWYALAFTLLWLAILPNTFYMITDFIHIQELTQEELLYGIVMLASFILNGVLLGLLSVYIVHFELLKRLKRRSAHALVGMILLICSFAIYIGRELRWNTWDILANPASLLFDVTDRLLHVGQHPQVVTLTLSFFVLLASLYGILWHIVRASRQQPEV